MKNVLIIFTFTILVTLFYRHVGQLVPQKEVPAPKEVEIKDDLTTTEMVEVGKTLVESRCMSCHGIQPRFPDLKGIGSRAGTQREGHSDIEYLAESLYEPNAFIVPPFAAGMTPANKPPLNLSDQEILTVIAYLQSLGGTPTVSMATRTKYHGQGAPPAGAAPATGQAAPAAAELTPDQLLTNYGCIGCHSITTPDRMVGPSLFDAGKRLTKAQIYEAIMDPDATLAEGFPPGMMGATLQGTGFYNKVTSAQLKALVEHLANLKGGS